MIIISNYKNRTWAEIDLENVKYNYLALKNFVPKGTKTCCVLKSDAYGHGAARVAQLLVDAGADFFAVATIDEALSLRNYGIDIPILVLGYTPPERVGELSEHNISQSLYSYEYAKLLAEHAARSKLKINVHVKIDTGMGRIGFVFRQGNENILDELREVCSYDCFIREGIFTHFPVADAGIAGKATTDRQYELFCKIISILEENGITFDIRHCANSATTIDYPQYSLDMVRFGIALYGAMPSDTMNSDFVPKTTLTLKTVVSNVKLIRAGDTIGYGCTYVAQKDTKVATLPIGYADGILRSNSDNGAKISINGKLCSIIGRICMDQLMVDVTGLDDLKIGDVAIIFGEGSEIDVQDFARVNNTIPYEIFCNIGARVTRIYKNEFYESNKS